MIYLSAQPDDYFFLWQLELQLYNFRQLGISPDKIHVLIAYDPVAGLRHYFRDFILEQQQHARIFTYPDNRKEKMYISSVRPHIIRQHVEQFPELEKETIFYHDSDVLFRALPDYSAMPGEDTWYVSDTASYLNGDYILKNGGPEMLKAMCEVVGVSENTVLANNVQTGGAQYVLKQVPAAFWEKVESDCLALFKVMTRLNNAAAEKQFEATGTVRTRCRGIQAWCADMWALLWNAWREGRPVKVSPEMDFCWPKEPIERWHQTNILHYSGVTRQDTPAAFFKLEFLNYPPFYEKFESIDTSTCNQPLISMLQAYRKEKDKSRTDLRDVTFLIPFFCDSPSRLENIKLIIRYLDKYFDTHILVAECGASPALQENELPECCRYIFRHSNNPLFHHTAMNNLLVREPATKFIAICDTDIVLPLSQMIRSVEMLRTGEASMVSPFSGELMSVDRLSKRAFDRILDPDLFYQNCSKFPNTANRSWGAAIFINRADFIAAGMDNEYFESWGPEDIERVKRMKHLGYTVKRIPGPVFHLPHERGINSAYVNAEVSFDYLEEYLKICNMRTPELAAYVQSWPWTANNHSLSSN